MKISAYTLAIALAAASTTNAFVTPNTQIVTKQQQCSSSVRFMAEGETESAFVADVAPVEEGEADKTFDAVEKMGRGAAKVR